MSETARVASADRADHPDDRRYPGDSWPVETGLAGLALGAASLLALLLLASLALAEAADAFDPAILLRVRGWTGDQGAAVDAARVVTAFGDDLTLASLTVVAAGYLARGLRRSAALRLLATASAGGLMTVAVKLLVARPRPALVEHLVAVRPPSFPSGHATNSTVVYGTLALIAAERAATPAARTYLAVATVCLVVLVGSSRVVLGVHWPSDVLAGWCLGSSWALLAAVVARRIGRNR